MTTRTSLVAFAALVALATTAMSPTSASAFGGHFAQGANRGFSGYGGAPNPAATNPGPHVPGATVSQSSGGMVGRTPRFPFPNRTGATPSMPSQTTGTASANGQTGQGGWKPGMPTTTTQTGSTNQPANGNTQTGQGGWKPGTPGTQTGANQPPNGNGQNGWTPGSQGNGRGPWGPGQMASNQPCGYGCGNGWNRWHHPYYGQGSYVETAPVYTAPTVYTQAPVYQAPAYQAPVYQAPVQTTYTPAPQTYTQPAPTYASAPSAEPCNCLTKSYMQDGSVMFTDICTKETAMAAPAGWQQGQTAPQPN